MDISAKATTVLNPELNISNILQMFKMAGLVQSEEKGRSTEGTTGNGFENILLQVLQQNMAVLMQSDKSGTSPEFTAKQDLLAALQELIPDDEAAAGEILSGLALLAVTGKTDGLVEGQSEFPDKEQAKVTLLQDEKEIRVSKTLESPVDKNSVRQVSVPELITKDKSIEASKQMPRASQASALTADTEMKDSKSAGAQDKTSVINDIQDNLSRQATSDVGRQILPEEQMKITSVPEHQVSALNGYTDVQRTAANEGRDKAPQFKNAEGMSVAEKPSGENPGAKVNVSFTGVVQESKPRLNLFNGTQLRNTEEISDAENPMTENQSDKANVSNAGVVPKDKPRVNLFSGTQAEVENLTSQREQDEAGQEVKTKFFAKLETPAADKKSSSPINDMQKNIAVKAAESGPDAAGMIDKAKTDFKNKAVPGEKNIESNSFNSSTASGLNSAKLTSSDVSPVQIIERVAAQLNDGLLSDGGRVKITLAPPSLGTLEMDVVVRNGVVKVMLIADNKDVQQMLSGNLDSLKGSLQSQGLTIERLDVMMQDRREQYSQGFNQQQAFNQESSTKHHYDEGEGYIQDKKTIIPMEIRTVNPATGTLSKISLFV